MDARRTAALLATLLSSVTTTAQTPPPGVKPLATCIESIHADKLEAARACLLGLKETSPSVLVLYHLGRTEQGLGNPVEAYEAYQACLVDTSGALAPDQRRDVLRRLEHLATRLGFLRVKAPVAGTVVLIDGDPKGRPSPAGLPVRPGRHVVRVEAPGAKPWRAEVVVAAGEVKDVTVGPALGLPAATAPAAAAPPVASTPTDPRSGERSRRAHRIAFWSSAGGAVAAFVIAGAASWKTSDLSRHKRAAIEDACAIAPNGPACLRYIPECGDDISTPACRYNVPGNDACLAAGMLDPNTGQPRNAKVADLCSQARALTPVYWAFFPVAIALTAASGYFLWSGYLSPRRSERPRVRLTPTAGPTGVTLAAGLEF